MSDDRVLAYLDSMIEARGGRAVKDTEVAVKLGITWAEVRDAVIRSEGKYRRLGDTSWIKKAP